MDSGKIIFLIGLFGKRKIYLIQRASGAKRILVGTLDVRK